MRVLIVGLGETAIELARMLARQPSTELVLIDLDDARCERISEELDALVIPGDGSDPEVLRKGQIDVASVIVASTGSDAINTVIAILGRQLGVEKVIVKLKGNGLRSACREIGVTRIISPQLSAAAEIVSVIQGFDRVNFSLLVGGGLHLVDLAVPEGAGCRLSEVETPEGTLVVAISREGRLHLPRPGFKLDANDLLLVLLERDELIDKVRAAVQHAG